MTQAIRDELGDLVHLSRRIHFVAAAVVGAPAIVLVAYLSFPLLETRNLGYPFFHLACALAFTLSGAGTVAWFAEQRFCGRFAAWLSLLILVLECLGCLALRLTGDFYWAFQRGYFLD